MVSASSCKYLYGHPNQYGNPPSPLLQENLLEASMDIHAFNLLRGLLNEADKGRAERDAAARAEQGVGLVPFVERTPRLMVNM